MTMMAGHFTGKMPFNDVYIHGLVRDENGKKMSKSANNGIDPLLLINKYGTDALRYTLIREVAGAGQDISLQYDRQKDESESVEASRNFANKLWNAARFVMMNLEGQTPAQLGAPKAEELELADQWILSRLNQVTQQTRDYLEHYGLGEAAKGLYEFIWGDFCDWYIELVKPRLWNKAGGDNGAKRQLVARQVLAQGLDSIVKLLHPFMPHVTEELWQTLHQAEADFLARQPYPEGIPAFINPDLESQFTLLINTLRTIRNLRAEAGIKPGALVTVILQSENDQERQILIQGETYLKNIGKVETLEVVPQVTHEHSQCIAGVVDTIQVLIPLSGLVDVGVLRGKIQKNLDKVNKEYESINKRLSNPGFVNKAPQAVIEGAREALGAAETQQAMLMERLRRLQ
jgi:valyl-tRNA synthetase